MHSSEKGSSEPIQTKVKFGDEMVDAADFWEEEEVNLRLEKKMVRAFHEVYDMAQEQKSHLRTGAYLLSVKRVADAMSVRGIYP